MPSDHKHFEELDPEVALKMLEGHQDILTPMAKRRDQVYRDLVCPCCDSRDLKPVDKGSRDDEPVPWHHFDCQECGCLYDPMHDLVLKEGNPSTSVIESLNPERE